MKTTYRICEVYVDRFNETRARVVKMQWDGDAVTTSVEDLTYATAKLLEETHGETEKSIRSFSAESSVQSEEDSEQEEGSV